MKKFFALILILCTCILVMFSGSSSGVKTTDFFDKFEGSNADSLISKPYYDFSSSGYSFYYNSPFSFGKEYTYTLGDGVIHSYIGTTRVLRQIVIYSDYVYDITFKDDYASYVSNLLDSGSLFIDVPYEYLTVRVYMKPSDLIGYELYDDIIPSNGIQGIIQSGYAGYILYVDALSGDGYRLNPDYSKLEQQELQKAFDHFFYELDLEFIPRSDDISYGFRQGGYNYGSLTFYNSFILVDFSIGNGGKFIENISVQIDSIGSPPSIPDSSDYDGALEFVGAYFSWITKEIVYIFKFAGVFLKGVF